MSPFPHLGINKSLSSIDNGADLFVTLASQRLYIVNMLLVFVTLTLGHSLQWKIK